jgi:hypothetical protein
MTESSLPLPGPADAVDDAADAKRRKMILAGVVGVVVLVAAVYFLFLSGGGGSTTSAAPVVPSAKAATTKTVHKTASHAAKTTKKRVPSTFKDVVGRDPFTPLWSTEAAAAPTGSTGDTGSTGTTSGTPTTVNSGSGSGVTTTSTGQQVTLLRIFTKHGKVYAQTKIGSTVYTPHVGQTFATTFQLLSVKGKTATYLDGDVQFSLREGQEVLK